MYTTITPSFQIHIPVEARRKSGINKHGKIKVRAMKNKIIIEPIESKLLSLAGKYQVTKPTFAEDIRSYIDYSDGKK